MTEKINKGEYLGECNRKACNNTPATHYNFSTEKCYCKACAMLINDANRSDAMRLYGHNLCLPVDSAILEKLSGRGG